MNDRFRHGLVLGKFWPLHAGHSHLIERALAECTEVTIQLWARAAEDVPLDVRRGWIAERHPRARLVAEYDETPVDFDDPAIWDLHIALIRSRLHTPVDAVFTSDDYGAEMARRLDATWVQVDPGRTEVPVSGTAVRADPASHWEFLAPCVRSWYVDRVVVTGAESTGTTTLAQALAHRLGAAWVPEFGREWTAERPGGPTAPWRSEEFPMIAARQVADEEEQARRTPVPWLVADTDAWTTRLWHRRYVPGADEAEQAAVAAAGAAQVDPLCRILTGDEIPFVQDGMRDGEHLRHRMQQEFRERLALESTVPWIEVHGTVEDRVEQSLALLRRLRPRAAALRTASPGGP